MMHTVLRVCVCLAVTMSNTGGFSQMTGFVNDGRFLTRFE